ncbi:hypothetical protein QJS04_geneDACA018055 [Acorus gramineus]|uniref:MYND-type domain-containing protein n=1 Tax=Acorus gramineus TaxID=55184 RepID=A0AAV9A986_ACOGR|nr:hypothetical protein QJS04_geneDACA018055 [Acorus gramineus]
MEVHIQDLLSRLHEQFGLGPGLGPSSATSLTNSKSLPQPFITSLSRAAAALHRTDPWRRLRPNHLFGVRVGKDSDWPSKKEPFPVAQFIGGDGGDLAVHLYRSESDALKSTAPRETLRVPDVEVLRITFDAERCPVFDVARCASDGGLWFRNPTLEELKFAYAVVKAVSLVHPLLVLRRVSDGRTVVAFEPFVETVDVQWPPEMANAEYDFVAVTVSHPPGQSYEEVAAKPLVSMPAIKYADPPEDAQEVRKERALCCGRCRAVVYCGAACQKQHWKETHKAKCGLYKAMMEREEELDMSNSFTFPTSIDDDNPCRWLDSLGLHKKGMWRRQCACYARVPFGLLPTTSEPDEDDHHPLVLPTHVALSGWTEYYKLRSLPTSSPIAAVLSHALTVYHVLTALCVASKDRLAKAKEVVLHYIGPECELDCMRAFVEPGRLLQGLGGGGGGGLHVVMVGPEVPSGLSEMTITGRVRASFVRGLYQDEAAYLPPAHVVVGLNCGFERYASWGGVAEVVKAKGTPGFFTERSEIACANAKQVLRGVGVQVTHPVTPNLFRSPVRVSSPSDNLPAFDNGFVFGVNT